MTYKEEKIKEMEELAHAYFEPGDKDYWDGIEFGKSYLSHNIDELEAKHQKEIEDVKYKAFFEGYDLGVEKQMLRKFLKEIELEEVKEKIKNVKTSTP